MDNQPNSSQYGFNEQMDFFSIKRSSSNPFSSMLSEIKSREREANINSDGFLVVNQTDNLCNSAPKISDREPKINRRFYTPKNDQIQQNSSLKNFNLDKDLRNSEKSSTTLTSIRKRPFILENCQNVEIVPTKFLKHSKSFVTNLELCAEDEFLFIDGDIVKSNKASNNDRESFDGLGKISSQRYSNCRPDKPIRSLYYDITSMDLWQFYMKNRQTEATFTRKVQLRNALRMIMAHVFEESGLFIFGSSMSGFGSCNSDMDLSLAITCQEFHQKKEAFAVLSELMEPLRSSSFVGKCQLIKATVPILKFRDKVSGIECDLNINNLDGIYNTHLLSMYNRVDWRLRPLVIFIKHWIQQFDLHDASKGRLSSYTIVLMVIQYLQAGCTPPVLPCLQALFPHQFSYQRSSGEVDMSLELPWNELQSHNNSGLAHLLMGFFEYYLEGFDFSRLAVSIRTGKPIPIDVAINQLNDQLQMNNAKSSPIFVEEPFSLSNVSRSVYDESVFPKLKRCLRHSLQVLRLKQPLHSMYTMSESSSSEPADCGATQTMMKTLRSVEIMNLTTSEVVDNGRGPSTKVGRIVEVVDLCSPPVSRGASPKSGPVFRL